MKSKKIGAGLLAFLMAATTAAASAQTAFAADLGTVTDNVPAITAASASVSVLTASGDLEAATWRRRMQNGALSPVQRAITSISSPQAAAIPSWTPCWCASIRIVSGQTLWV